MQQRLAQIALHYLRQHRRCRNTELSPFKKYSLKKAVEKAGLAENGNGKRFSHQRRIPKKILLESQKRLLNARRKLSRVHTFKELYETIKKTIGAIKGIGELTVYDTALRIGANLGLEPKVVYLHAGTLKGAGNLGLYTHQPVLSINEIPSPLCKLKPLEIEDVLCIYKNCFLCQKKNCPLPQRRCGDNGTCGIVCLKSRYC